MRVGLVGCGAWGRFILRDLRSLGAEVMVVARSEASQGAAREGGAVSIHSDIDDLPLADGYVVATSTGSHAEIIDALLPRGRPVFVEKPLTDDPVAAASIASRAGARVFSMDKWRYHPGVLKLAELAQSGHLGRVRHVQSWRLGWEDRSGDTDSIWRLLPHDLSIALEILGHLPQLAWAYGFHAFDIRSEATAVLQEEGGPSVGLAVSGCHPVNRRSVLVVGSEGSAQFGGSFDDKISVRYRDGTKEEIDIATDMPLLAELRVFLEHLRGGPPPKSPAPEAALIVLRIAEIRAMAGIDRR
jgi:predicted dehydrogenase